MDKAIKIEQLGILSEFSTEFSQMDKNYIISHLKLDNKTLGSAKSRGVKFDGLSILLVMKGAMKLSVNTEVFDVEPCSLVVTGPNTIMKIEEALSDELDLFLLFLAPQFFSSINIDLNVLHKSHLGKKHTPVLAIPPVKATLLGHYMEMLHINALSNPVGDIFTKNISRSLIAALVYQIMQIADHHYAELSVDNTGSGNLHQPGTRRLTYVKEFMSLVHSNYTVHRSVGFYASKLCISPKYLSFIIKDVTGRSAAEWIDEYVILEAKNMLRFSGMNVQEVAYALNFSNQSAFGKYFKHLTGMSPTQFQKN